LNRAGDIAHALGPALDSQYKKEKEKKNLE
jgi:hypothetical protein